MVTIHRNPEFDTLAEEHRRWLSSFDPQHARNWEKLYKSDYEGAMNEAGMRRLLESHRIKVEPNEKLTGKCGGPDFRCDASGTHFYVEATCVTMEAAARRLDVKVVREGLSSFNATGMLDAIFNECVDKAPQCANVDAPVLVAVGTFHWTAAMTSFKKPLINMVLTGKAGFAWDIDVSTGRQIGPSYQTTALERAVFLKPDKNSELAFARSSISGLLLCGVGLGSQRSIGVVHPNPERPFDPALLPDIEFGRVEIASGELTVHWPNP